MASIELNDPILKIGPAISLIWIFCHIGFGQNDQKFPFQNLGVEDGLSQSSVISMAQDSTGYLWMATQDGLNRYSGRDFVHYKKQFEDVTRPTFSRLGKVYVDREDRLWIITKFGKLELYRPETDDFEWIPCPVDVSTVFQADNLDFYIGTHDNGLFRIDQGGMDTVQVFNPRDFSGSVYDFLEVRDSIWISGSEKVFVLKGDRSYSQLRVDAGEGTHFSALALAGDQTIWLGSFGKGLFHRPPGEKGFVPFKHPELPKDLIVEDLLVDGDDGLWIATYGHGVYRYDPRDHSLLNFTEEPDNPFAVDYNDILCLYQDDSGVLWLGTDGSGANYFDPYHIKFNILTNKQLPKGVAVDVVRSIATDPQGNLWLGTSGKGLTKIDLGNNLHHTYAPGEVQLSSGRIISLNHDGTDLWIGHQGFGLDLMGPNGEFRNFPELADHAIWGIVQESGNRGWLCTESNGLLLFDKHQGVVERYNGLNSNLPTNDIRTVVQGEEDIWWLGSADKGLFRLDRASGEIVSIGAVPDKIKSLYHSQGFLWVGTNGTGLIKYNVDSGEAQRFSMEDGLPNEVVYGILPDGDGGLWLSSNKGISQFDTRTDVITNYNNPVYLQSLEFNTGAYHRDRTGHMYFGGIKGVNWFDPARIGTNPHRPKTAITEVRVFDTTRKLSDKIPLTHKQNTISFTFSSLQFSQPKLNQYRYRLLGQEEHWIHSGNENKVRYTNLPPGKYEFQVLSSNYDGLWGELPATHSFEIDQPWNFSNLAKAVFTSFVLQGCFIAIGIFMLLLYLRLKRKDYLLYGLYLLLFSVYFFLRIDLELQTSLFVKRAENINYLLMPLNFLFTGVFINFVNSFAEIKDFHPGFSREVDRFAKVSYLLAVLFFVYLLLTADFKLVNDHMNLILLPVHLYAIYAVIRAFVVVKSPLRFYILLGNFFLIGFSMVGVFHASKNSLSSGVEANDVFGFYSFNITQMGVFLEMIVFSLGLGHKFYMVELEKDKIQKTDELKTQLFTDISHEIRTPLTLITGPVENQLAREGIAPEDHRELSLIKDNANRLLGLVNQILDLSKIDLGQYRPKPIKGDLKALLVQLVEAFGYLAKERDIGLLLDIKNLDAAWFDRDVVEKAVSNLLSNAIKYAPFGSEVLVSAGKEGEEFVFSVLNRVDGKPIEDPEILFQRFYQRNGDTNGIGVGLTMIRELVSLSGGTLGAQGVGKDQIRFTLQLPVGRRESANREETAPSGEVPPTESPGSGKVHGRPCLLLVEDDPDILKYLRSIFEQDYGLLTAHDGKQGMEKALSRLPDLIISDIMMPGISGIELCDAIKQNRLSSHIPVILLTAKAGEEHETQGFATGADAYITKPFSPQGLKVRVDQLIQAQKRLALHFRDSYGIEPELALTNTETEFLKSLNRVLEAHITDVDFNTDTFSRSMNMSRRQLHRKLKAILGMTPTEFVRHQRIKLAVGLLENSDATISEIAYQVGFNSPSYFIKCFKEIHGSTPYEFAQNP